MDDLNAKTDGALLGDFLAGRAQAFEQIVRRHGAMVLAVCRRVTGETGDAEDASQAAFVALSRKARRLAGTADLGPWLYRAAWYSAATALRNREVHLAREREAGAMRERERERVREREDWSERDWQEVRRTLDRAMAGLSERHRSILVMCYLEGRTQEQAASALGLSRQTVIADCQKALEKLRRVLGGSEASLSAAGLGAMLLAKAFAPVPATLIGATMAAVGGSAGANVSLCAKGVVSGMFWASAKTAIAAAVLGVAILAGAGGIGARLLGAEGVKPAAVAPAAPAPAAPEGGQAAFDPAKYELYPPDADFKARWEKVKHKYLSSYKDKEPKPADQATFLAAWEKGSPMTRLMLTQKLVELEDGTMFGKKVSVPRSGPGLVAWAEGFDRDFPALLPEQKAYLFEKLRTWAQSHGGPSNNYWDRIPSYVASLSMAARYPEGCDVPKERPFLYVRRADLPELKKRLEKDPWKTWYALVVKISDAYLAGKDGSDDEELRLRFPLPPGAGKGASHLPYAAECCALRYFVEGRKEYGLKAKETLQVLTMRGKPVKAGTPWYDLDMFIWDSCWAAWQASAYDLVADLFTPAERLDYERKLLYWGHQYQAGAVYNFNMTWFRQEGAGLYSMAVGYTAGVERIAGEIRKYVNALAGEGENVEYWAYKSHVYENLIGPFSTAYKHVYGKDCFGPMLEKYAQSIRHYVRAASPLGTMPEFGDCQNMQSFSCYHVWALNVLPEPARGELMWHWLRSGDPRFVHVQAPDAKRLTGGKFPVYTQGWSPMDDQYDSARRERRWPVGEAKLVRAILTMRDPLPEPVAPEPDSYIAPKLGGAYLRTGLEPDDLQLTTHTRRVGSIGFHGQRDTLSVLMYAYGSPVIVHPGYHDIMYAKFQFPVPEYWKRWGYGFNANPDFYNSSAWSRSVASIGVDGGLDSGAGNWMKHQKAGELPVEALTANSGDGYFGKSDPKGHFRRAIFLVRSDPSDMSDSSDSLPKGYFVLVDDVLTTKADADVRWTIQPRGTKVEGDGDTKTWTSYDFLNIPPKPVRLMVHTVRPPESKVTMVTGVWNLYPDPDGEERPFPMVDWKGPGRMITVLHPLAEGMEAPKIENLPGRKGVKVGEDTIEADAEKVTFTRGGKAFVVELKPAAGK